MTTDILFCFSVQYHRSEQGTLFLDETGYVQWDSGLCVRTSGLKLVKHEQAGHLGYTQKRQRIKSYPRHDYNGLFLLGCPYFKIVMISDQLFADVTDETRTLFQLRH